MLRKLPIAAVLALVALVVAGAGGAVAQPAGWCKAASSGAWPRVLDHHVVPLSQTTPLHPIAVAGSRRFFTQIYTKTFTGVAEVDASSGQVTRIKAFPDPTPPLGDENADQAVGAFDGRWLVWNEYRGEMDFNRFTTWAWDSRTRKLTRLGAATKAPDGQFWLSPWRGPDVRDGVATWVQGSGPDQLADVHAYNLRTGHDRMIRRGHPNGALLLHDHVVVWLEASAPGRPVLFHAASALTGRRLPLARALRGLDNVVGLDSDGRQIAYPLFSYRSLWWSPSLREQPRQILRTRSLQYVDNDVQIGGAYIGFGIQPRTFVGDTRSRRYVETGNTFGSSLIGRGALLVSFGNGERAKSDPLIRIALVPLRKLPPVPACRKRT